MNIFKKTLLAVLALGGASVTISAYADCTFASGYSANTQEAINFGDVTVPPSTPVGTVVASKTSTLIGSRGYFITGCTTFNQHDWRSPGLPAVSYGGQTLYQSGVTGYAIRIVTPGAGSTAGKFGSGAFDRILTNSACRGTADYCGGSWGNVTFELVKIASDAGSGQLSAGTLVRASIRGWQYIYTANLTTSTITTPGCTVTNTTINVPMGNVKRNTFTGVGYQSTPVPVNILMNCQPRTQVSYRIDATADSSGVADVIAIDKPSTGTAASGVGITLTDRGNPVALGTTIPHLISAGGLMIVQLYARYYQTAPRVTAGKADATATFTLTYN